MREETAPPEGGRGGSGEWGGEKRPMVGGRSREEEAAFHSSSASSPSLSLSLSKKGTVVEDYPLFGL